MLKSENEDLDALIEAAPLGIVVFDSNAAIIRWNPAAEKIFGWKEREVINRTYNPVLPDDSDEIHRRMREKLLSGGSLTGEELIRKRKDGKLIFVKAHTSLLKDKAGNITGVIGMYDDITLQKTEHEKLVWNELLLSQMTESSRNGFYLVDNRSDRMLYCNSRFAELWGLKEFDNLHKLNNEQLIELCAGKVIDEHKYLSTFKDLNNISNTAEYNDEINLKDGRYFKYYTTQLKDSAGNYLGRFFMFEDITESKFYEALLRSENEYNASVNNSGDAIIVVNPEQNILIFNNAAGILLNTGKSKLTGAKLQSVLKTGEFIFKENLSYGKTETFIKEVKLPGGKTLNLEIHVRLHTNNKIQLTLYESGKINNADLKRDSFSELQNRFVFTSDIMKKLNFELSRLANLDFDVLIEGETGVGKDLAAMQIHLRSKRKNYPFIPVSISSLSDSLIESELFGHEKGAYSGAEKQIIGKFEAADKGILYIPEISTLPEKIQLKLLHFMQYKSISRVGQDARLGEIKLDVKLIMATNENMEELVNSGRIRKDFYYRISGTKLTIPPLRDRKEDIKEIAEYYLGKFSEKYPGKHFSLSDDSVKMLREYPWNGNVRELVSCIRNVISFNSDPVIKPVHFKNLLKFKPGSGDDDFKPEQLSSFNSAETEFKKKYFKQLMKNSNNKIKEAAKLAGMTPQGLRKALTRLGL